MPASSFHLKWVNERKVKRVEAVVEVVTAPPKGLVFWALEATVYNAQRQEVGGVHIGLQAIDEYPGRRAVNFGGYNAAGQELSGTTSILPSKTNNPNTRNFAWRPRKKYRLILEIPQSGGTIRGYVDGQLIRTLTLSGARTLGGPSTWTEDFRACSAPKVSARWSRLRSEAAAVRAVTATYNHDACADTNSRVEGDAFRQDTRTRRTVAQGTRLTLP